MDRLEAIEVLLELVHAAEDEKAREALELVVGGGPPFPPSTIGAVGGSALELAKHVHKTGLEWDWRTPAPDSVGMERLVHRMTTLLEAFLNMWEEERERIGDMTLHDVIAEEMGLAGWIDIEVVDDQGTMLSPNDELAELIRQRYHVDGAYQPDYCDVCGEQLLPDGTCVAEGSEELTTAAAIHHLRAHLSEGA